MDPIYHHVSTWSDQYRKSVCFTFSTIHIPGCPIGLFSQSKYHAMWNWKNNWLWRHWVQSILRVTFAFGISRYQSFRVQLVSDMIRLNTKWSLKICIYWSMISSKIRLGGTSLYMKPLPVIFLFSSARDSFSNTWNFDWNPCLARKWANVTKAFTISVPYPFLHLLWWYFDTFKIVENKYLLIDFFRMDW